MFSLLSSLTTVFSSAFFRKNLDGGNLSFVISFLLKEGHRLCVNMSSANIDTRAEHSRIPGQLWESSESPQTSLENESAPDAGVEGRPDESRFKIAQFSFNT